MTQTYILTQESVAMQTLLLSSMAEQVSASQVEGEAEGLSRSLPETLPCGLCPKPSQLQITLEAVTTYG